MILVRKKPIDFIFLTKAIFKNVLLFSLLFFFLSSLGLGQTVTLSEIGKIYQPKEEVFYLWDKKKEKSFNEIISDLGQKEFIWAGKDPVNFGIINFDTWFKVNVKNEIPERETNWIIELAYTHYDTLEFYFKNENGRWDKIVTGDRTPYSTREIFNKGFAFPVVLSDTSTHAYYFHIMGDGSRQFPLFIQTRNIFFATQEKISIVYAGIFFGIISIMLLYNLFIYFSLKDKIYLYYVLANTCTLIFYIGYSGYGFQYLWRDYPDINEVAIPIGMVLTGLADTVFARSFLDTKTYLPIIDKIFLITLFIYILDLISIPFISYDLSLKMFSLQAIISSILIFYSSYWVWIKGNKSARFMAVAFTVYLVGVLLISFNVRGYLSRNFVVAHSMEVGTAVEITLLSFALSDKYSRLRKEKEHAQAELINVHKKTNIELERKVEERTEEINKQKQELEELNKVNHKLLSIISHDLKGPLNAFQSLLSMMLKDELTKEKVSMYTLHLNNKLSHMVGLVDNLLHWVRSQMEGIKLDIQDIKIKDLIKENVNLFSSQSELKNIEIVEDVSESIIVPSDKHVVRLVIRNLLGNALKFTENGGKVFISASINEDSVMIEVRDTGVGMDQEKINKLFTDSHFTTPDTNKKEGTGLGLLLCREFLLKVNGEIWVESEQGKGSSFKFKLPKVPLAVES